MTVFWTIGSIAQVVYILISNFFPLTFAKYYGGGKEWPEGKINGSREKNGEKGEGKNKTKERRNPPKVSLLLGAELISLREGVGINMIHLHNI